MSRKKREKDREERSGNPGAILSFCTSHISLRAKLNLHV
jgi:hypothetical protein